MQGSIPDPQNLLTQWQIINTTTWTASDNVTIRNITSYSQIRNAIRADFFGGTYVIPPTITGLNIVSLNPLNVSLRPNTPTGAAAGSIIQFNNIYSLPGNPIADQGNLTEEIQLRGRGLNDRLTYQFGGYAEFSDPLGDSTAYASSRLFCADRFTLQCTDTIGRLNFFAPGNLTVQRFKSSYHDFGAYAQASYKITDQLTATGGIDYTWDRTVSNTANLAPGQHQPQRRGRLHDLRTREDRHLRGRREVELARARARHVQRRGLLQRLLEPAAQPDLPGHSGERVPARPGDRQRRRSRIYGVDVEAAITPFRGLRIDGSYAYIKSKLRSVRPVDLTGSPYNTTVPLTNVTQKKYFVQNNDNFTTLGFVSGNTSLPRMYGVRLRYSFGR